MFLKKSKNYNHSPPARPRIQQNIDLQVFFKKKVLLYIPRFTLKVHHISIPVYCIPKFQDTLYGCVENHHAVFCSK